MSAQHSTVSPIAGGIVLAAAATLALVVANSPLAEAYANLLRVPGEIRLGRFGIEKPLLLWINDGLMAVFFVLVGLEIKRELLVGELAGWQRAALPAIAAVGGFIVPALVFLVISGMSAPLLKAWAIPTATDIAFVVGIVAMLGRAVPPALRVFVVALAIIDDLLAIIVIAVFYTLKLSLLSLAVAAVCIAGLIAMNRLGVRRLAPYILVGLVMWTAVLQSGVHATLAGVALALTIPFDRTDGHSMVERFEHGLAPYVALLVVPIFAFANAGVALHGVSVGTFTSPLTLGIIAGLVIGKCVGIAGAILLATSLKLAPMPQGTSWPQIIGMACLAGIGFTMSLFIGSLALPDPESQTLIRLGVLTGSAISAAAGAAILLLNRRRSDTPQKEMTLA